MQVKEILKGLGLLTYEAEVYEALVRLKQARVQDLVRTISVPRAQIYAALKRLTDKGICVEIQGRFISYAPAPPSVAFKTALKHEEEDLRAKVEGIQKLNEEYQRSGSESVPVNSVQVLKGRQIKNFIDDMAAATKEEMLIFMKSAAGQSPKSLEGATRLEVGLLERGVSVRCLYEESSLADENIVSYLERLLEAGEDARIVPVVPMNMTVFDTRAAMYELPEQSGDLTVFAFVHPGIVTVMKGSFEHWWAQGKGLKQALRERKKKKPAEKGSMRRTRL